MAESAAELPTEIEKLERKYADNPDARYFVPLANAYRKAGDFDRAEELLRNGLQRHPSYLSAHIVLGRSFADRGLDAQAEEEFRHVLSVDPQNLIALRTLAELAVAAGRREDAGRWYRELLAVDPMNEEAQEALRALGSLPEEQSVAAATAEDAAEQPSAWPEEEPAEAAAAGELVSDGLMEEPQETPAAVETAGTEADAPEFEPEEPTVAEAALKQETQSVAERELHVMPFQGGGSIPPEAELDEVDSELITETIAELYARQGFFDRAANVYRELIRRQGDAPHLRQRLEELERIAEASSSADVVEEVFLAAPEVTAEEIAEPQLAAAVDPTIVAADEDGRVLATQLGGEQAAVASEGTAEPTIAEYLANLLAWQPSQAAQAEGEADWIARIDEDWNSETGLQSSDAEDAKETNQDSHSLRMPDSDAKLQALPEPEVETSLGVPDAAAAQSPREPGGEAASPARAASNEDDDLESFQRWLKSLRR